MKKLFFLLAMLAGIAASATVTVTPLSTDFTAKKVTFRVAWNSAAYNNRVWVWIDLCPIAGTQPSGNFTPAVVASPTKVSGNGSISNSTTRGFFITYAGTNSGTTVTATLSNAVGKFNWCAHGSDYPPNATMNNGTYTLKGTPPFTINTTITENGKSYSGNCITALTDKTGCPGIIDNNFSAGSIITASYNSCNNTAGTATTVAAAPAGSGSYSYQWTVSRDNGTAATVSGATLATYTPPATATAGTYRYMRQVKDGLCNTTFTNSAGTVTRIVYEAFSAGSITTASYNSCNNVAGTATAVSTAPSGGNGSYSYQWTVSRDNGTASTISGATLATYTPPATATAGTYRYMRQVKDGLCNTAFTNSAGTITRIVYAAFSAGSITTASYNSCNSTAGTATAVSTAPSGGNGSYSYQWTVSRDNGTASTISGATLATYTPPATATAGTYRYMRQVKDGLCNTTFTNSAGTVTRTVYATLAAGAINTSSATVITNGTAPASITSSTAASGGSGGRTYRWVRSGTSSATYSVNNAGHSFTAAEINTAGTWTYYREVRDNTCATTTWSCSSGSYVLTVISCPYTGSDLYLDATHLCQQRSSGAQNWEAYIKDSRDNIIYKIVQFSDNSWWFAEDLKTAIKRRTTCSGYSLYNPEDPPACPTGWSIPTAAQVRSRWTDPRQTDNYGGACGQAPIWYGSCTAGGTPMCKTQYNAEWCSILVNGCGNAFQYWTLSMGWKFWCQESATDLCLPIGTTSHNDKGARVRCRR